MSTQRREHPVPCRGCGPRVTTWNTTALCDSCTRLAALVPNPTQITEPMGGLSLAEQTAEADETQAAYLRWIRGESKYGAAPMDPDPAAVFMGRGFGVNLYG